MTRPPELDWPDDETLVAYADGNLDAASAAGIEARMAQDQDLRDYVQLLIRSGKLARDVFDADLQPADDGKLAAMIMGSAASKSADTSNVVTLPRARVQQAPLRAYALPMAAAIALMVGSVAGYQFGQRTPGPSNAASVDVAVGPVRSGSALATLLDERGSGDAMNLADVQRELMVIATFRDRAGRVCREFEVTDTAVPENGITAGVACRDASGWRIEGAANVASIPPASDQDFSPASGEQASAIEGILKAVGAKPALPKADEEALRKDGWK